jgi:hypothetical protein
VEKQQQIADRVESAAAHARLLADLMLSGPSLQEMDRGALARVLHDLAVKLERAAEQTNRCRDCPLKTEAEGRP